MFSGYKRHDQLVATFAAVPYSKATRRSAKVRKQGMRVGSQYSQVTQHSSLLTAGAVSECATADLVHQAKLSMTKPRGSHLRERNSGGQPKVQD